MNTTIPSLRRLLWLQLTCLVVLPFFAAYELLNNRHGALLFTSAGVWLACYIGIRIVFRMLVQVIPKPIEASAPVVPASGIRTIVHFVIWLVMICVIVLAELLPLTLSHHMPGWLSLELALVLGFSCWSLIGLREKRNQMAENFQRTAQRMGQIRFISIFWCVVAGSLIAAVFVIRYIDCCTSP